MRLTRVLAIVSIAMSFANSGAVAQSSSSARIPAEFPPASYTGRQYVDSRGCVFIRAGIDGQTTWIPRVTRDRKTICGFKPSIATATAQAAPAPSKPASKPENITVPQQAQAAKSKPAPKPVATAQRVAKPKPKAPAQKIVRTPTQAQKPAVQPARTVAKPAPKATATAKPAPKKVKVAKRPAAAEPACVGASAVSQQYIGSGGRYAVRCGPQAQPHATVISGGAGTGTTTRVTRSQPSVRTARASQPSAVQIAPTQQTRVAPRRVYENQLASQAGVGVPDGYKPVWEDDRLNPKRAHQTFAGKARMEVVWTKTVPRRLINRRTGREVTHNYPGLQYPYTSFEQQRAAGVIVMTRGQMVPDPITVTRSRDGTIRQTASTRTRAVAPDRQTKKQVVSTRGTAPKAPAKAASHRYVQVGIFSEPGKAQAAAQRLANAGLSARMGKTRYKGEPYTSVVVGPFATQAQLQSGMSAVRRAGYPNAYYRK